jgi:hypothetical protein
MKTLEIEQYSCQGMHLTIFCFKNFTWSINADEHHWYKKEHSSISAFIFET